MSDTDSNEYDSDSVEEEVAPEPTKKRGKAKKDPNKPKRNMSSFFLYSQANRADVKANNPDAAFGDIVSILISSFVQSHCAAVFDFLRIFVLVRMYGCGLNSAVDC
jgi:hypothetical protein